MDITDLILYREKLKFRTTVRMILIEFIKSKIIVLAP
jgi:hypothetical protein